MTSIYTGAINDLSLTRRTKGGDFFSESLADVEDVRNVMMGEVVVEEEEKDRRREGLENGRTDIELFRYLTKNDIINSIYRIRTQFKICT